MGNTTKQPFATLLRQERLKRNETQAELAEKVGVSVLTVTRWEQGKNKPYPCYRAKLCELFGKTAEELGLSENEVHAVYLAYAPSDEAYAYRLGQDLETQGFRIWNDQEVTRGTSQWKDSLRDILRETQAIIAILSPNTCEDRVVSEELALAEQQRCPVLAIRIAGKRWKEVLPVHQTVVHPLDVIDARKDNYEEVIDELLQKLKKLSSPQVRTVAPIDYQSQRNPYKGLLHFGTEEEDAHDFFGRNQLIEDSIDQLEMLLSSDQQARLLAFIGPSGVGKSSFVLAGLLPRLRASMDELPGSSQWIYLPSMHPGNHPVEALKETLGCVFQQKRLEDIEADLANKDARGLYTLTMQLTQSQQAYVVLVIDQFEELFTLTDDEQERQHFIDLLVKASTEQDGNLIVILTLCTDSYDRVLTYTELGRIVAKQQQVVFPMIRDELHAAITKPASHFDVRLDFEEELVIHLLCDVEGQVGALPLLQFTLKQLVDQRKGHSLIYETYEAIGGIKGALSNHAEEVYTKLSPEEQKLAHALFLRLVDPGKAEQDAISRCVSLSEFLLTNEAEECLLQRVIDIFVNERLLTRGKQGEATTIEISHRALIYGWKHLADWIEEAREDDLGRKFKRDVNRWKQEDETERELYTRTQLKDAQVWAENHMLNRDEVYFLLWSQWYIRQQRTGFFQKLVTIVQIILVIIEVLLWAILQLPAFTSSIMVTNTQDDGPGSLRAAIHAARSGQTVMFAPFLKGTIQLESEDLNIGRNITLTGFNPNFIAISSPSGKEIHIFRGVTVTINNLSFKDSIIRHGSIIYNEGTLTCNNCIFSKNISYYDGGAITNIGGSLTIKNSKIVNNMSSGNGGGIYNWSGIVNIYNTSMSRNKSYSNGGAIYSLRGAVTIDSSTISSNWADDSEGGGIDSVNGSLQLVNSTLTKNQSKGGGGGLAVLGSQGAIRQSSIYQNTAALYGGGLSVEKNSENDTLGQVSMTGIIVTDNPKNGQYFIGNNTATNTSETQPNIHGVLTIIANSVWITSTTDITRVSGSPAPKRPPEKMQNYRGIGDPEGFCQAKGYGRSALSEDHHTDVIACISPSGKPPTKNFSEQQVCQWKYPDDAADITARLADFFDESSLQCYAHVQFLGDVTTHLLQGYCQSERYNDVALIPGTGQTTAYDWKCRPSSGIPVGISITDVCQWYYHQQNAFDRLNDFFSPDGWECWAPKTA
jgi:transcriptional regulator with XRE-family HTH domain/putative hemolysin